MSPVILALIRALLVPIFAATIMLVYGYALGFFGDAIPAGQSPFYIYAKIIAVGLEPIAVWRVL